MEVEVSVMFGQEVLLHEVHSINTRGDRSRIPVSLDPIPPTVLHHAPSEKR